MFWKKTVKPYSDPFAAWPTTETDLKDVSLDNLQIIYDEAVQRLKESIEASDAIGKKSFSFFATVVVVFSGITAFFISEISQINPNYGLINLSLWSLAYLFILSLYLIFIIKPTFYKSAGTEPKYTLIKEKLATPKGETDKTTEKIFITERIKNFDRRIFENFESNKDNSDLLLFGMIGIYIFPLYAITCATIFLGL